MNKIFTVKKEHAKTLNRKQRRALAKKIRKDLQLGKRRNKSEA